MREILFRGKRIDDGEWVYGGCVFTENKVCLIHNQTHSIDLQGFTVEENSVGQYTGLTDKNGKKIFEGDIVQENGIAHKGEILIKGECSTVSFEKGCWVILSNVTWDFLQTNAKAVEVIGNIHDNPELLEANNEANMD